MKDTRKNIKLSPQMHRRLGVFKTSEGHNSFEEAIKYLLDKEAMR